MFRLVGLPIGLLCVTFAAYCAAQSLRFIITIAHMTGCDSYPAGVAKVFGSAAGTAVSHLTNFTLVLATGSHLKFLSGLLPRVLPAALSRATPLPLVAVALVMPLCVRRDISALRHVSIIAPLSLVYVIVLIISRGLAAPPEAAQSSGSVELLRSGDSGFGELPQAWSITLNALTFHHMAVPVFRQMERAQAQRVNKVVLRSTAYVSILYVLVGTSGFLTHGSGTPENILLVYPQGDRAAVLAQALVGCTLLLVIPLNVHAMRGQVLAILSPKMQAALRCRADGHLVLTAVLVLLPTAVGFMFPSVAAIIGIACGFGMVTYMFLVPAAVILYLRWRGGLPGESRSRTGSVRSEGSGQALKPDASRESFQDLLLSSPLSSPLLGPQTMVSPRQSCVDLIGLDEQVGLPPASGGDDPGAFELPEPAVAQASNCSSPRQRRPGAAWSPGTWSPEPSDLGDVETEWSPEFALSLTALALGSALGFVSAASTVVELFQGS